MKTSPSLLHSDVALELRGISKSFPGVKALEDVSLTLRQGRLHALLGENGAGKSTLMNILSGVFSPDSGEIRLNGNVVVFKNPRDAQEAGIAIIHQELNLVPNLTVAQNIFLGREPISRLGLIDDARMKQEALKELVRLKLDVPPETPVANLRVGQQQIVEIAKALSMRARILIMDEPTSAITEQEVAVLHDIIHHLKAEGVAIIYITHKLDELPRIADHYTVLRDGRWIGSGSVSTTPRNEMVRMMVGRDLSEWMTPHSRIPGEVVLRVQDLRLSHPSRPHDFSVNNVSFTLKQGEILGIFGLMGAGRTELLETLFGLHPKTSSGQIEVQGVACRFRNPKEAIEAGIVLAPEDRKQDGLILSLSVAANTTLACLDQIERFGLLNQEHETRLAKHYVNRLRTKTPSVNHLVRNLSGGNQQKVALSKWLALQPKALLLDEPTRGIDVNAKKEIYSLLDELVGTGLAVLLVSSELPEILAVSDRILVMCEGALTAEFSRAEANEEIIMKAALPKN